MIGCGLKTFEDHELELHVYDDKTTYCYGNNKFIQYADIEYDKEEGYTIIKYKDLIKKEEEKEYKVVKSFTLKDILGKSSCNSDNEVWIFTKELQEKNLSYDYIIDDWDKFSSFKTLMEYRQWFIDEEFIEKVKEEFKPFDLTFNISSKEELVMQIQRVVRGEVIHTIVNQQMISGKL